MAPHRSKGDFSLKISLQRFQAGLLAAVLVSPLHAQAFGSEGHHLVATIAEQHLSGRARSEIARLLALEPGASLVSISTWADDTRAPSTAAWHYVNLPRDADCHYDASRDCPDGQCIVGAIERQQKVLASTASDAERLKALKYLVHFVADVHQPLHAGYADDRGGNKYQVQAFGRGTNLHSVWDTGLIERWPGGPSALLADLKGDGARAPDASLPRQWAEESCRVVTSEGFYPPGHKIGADYVQRMTPVLKERLAAAGRRLAALLNNGLGGL